MASKGKPMYLPVLHMSAEDPLTYPKAWPLQPPEGTMSVCRETSSDGMVRDNAYKDITGWVPWEADTELETSRMFIRSELHTWAKRSPPKTLANPMGLRSSYWVQGEWPAPHAET